MKTFVFVGTSLDGFIARKDGDFSWLIPFQNEEVHRSYNQFIHGIDAIVIGRGTYDAVVNLDPWPYNKKVFLLSNSIKQIPNSLKDKISLISMKPAEVLAHLRDLGHLHIYVDGGKTIQSFLKEDCIDEIIITRVPVLIGSGIPLFDNLDFDIQFTHVDTEVFVNGLVKSRYRRKRD